MTTSPARKATPVTRVAATAPTGRLRTPVEAANWTTIRADLDDYGCALTGPLPTTGAHAGPLRRVPSGVRALFPIGAAGAGVGRSGDRAHHQDQLWQRSQHAVPAG